MKKLLGCLLAMLFVPSAASAAGWTQFRDPSEGAFALEVPAGWQVVGGLKRRSLNQPHPLIGALSPDRLTKIVIGDPNAIAYSEFTPELRRVGFRMGQSYTPHGEPEVIKNYRMGAEWAAELAEQELKQDGCTDIKVLRTQALPKLHPGLPEPPGAEHRDSVGEAYLSCVLHGVLYAAYAFSETAGDYYYQGGQVFAGVWTDDTSVVILTPQGMGGQAIAVANHMVGSIRWNPAWWQQQFHAAVAASNDLFAQSTRAISEQGQDWDRTIRGVENYTNPSTGKTFEVPITGASAYAQNGAGNIIGLVGTSQPPAGFTLMGKAHH